MEIEINFTQHDLEKMMDIAVEGGDPKKVFEWDVKGVKVVVTVGEDE